MNASFATIQAGMKPDLKIQASDRIYFRFPNGQWRRRIGEGKSKEEKSSRRAARNLRRERVITRSEE